MSMARSGQWRRGGRCTARGAVGAGKEDEGWGVETRQRTTRWRGHEMGGYERSSEDWACVLGERGRHPRGLSSARWLS